MSASSPQSQAQDEAADWITRLNRRLVDQRDLAAFRDWRQRPGNEAAFQDLRRTWRNLGDFADDPELLRELDLLDARRDRRRRWLPISVAVVGGVCAIVAVVLNGGAYSSLLRSTRYVTGVGERSVVRLADGSVVHLDTDSVLSVQLSRTARSLQLSKGQALFEVAHDGSRPFVVRAGTMSVTATGTRFDVRRDGSQASRVVLLEGRVKVADRGAAGRVWALTPGESLDLAPRSPPPRAPTLVNLQDATSWTTGVLTFRNAPLPDVVAEANRYSRNRLELGDDPRLAKLRVDGVFTAGDVEATAGSLQDIFDLAVSRRADGTIVLAPKPDGVRPSP